METGLGPSEVLFNSSHEKIDTLADFVRTENTSRHHYTARIAFDFKVVVC